MAVFRLLLALALCAGSITCTQAEVRYPDAYAGDWAALPVGKSVSRPDFRNLGTTKVIGDVARVVLKDKAVVHLSGIRLGVRWRAGYHKYRNATYLIRNCDRVVIENVLIRQLDPDYRASSSILIEDCNEVVIKDAYFAGTTQSYHVRIEGCRRIKVDNLEVEGLEYPGEAGRLCGGGLFINNGDPKMGGTRGMLSPVPMDLVWCVIQNAYFHDNTSSDRKRNLDAVLIHSAADGWLFNCYFKDWLHGDAALDVSHRRTDRSYRDHFFRIERNVFDNCGKIKTNGTSHRSNTLFFTNNLYNNTFIGDYHNGWDVFHVHETFRIDQRRQHSTFYSIWALANGHTHIANSLIYVTGAPLRSVYNQGKGAHPDNYRLVRPDFMIYAMPEPEVWLKGRDGVLKDWKAWQNTAVDSHSVFIEHHTNGGAEMIDEQGRLSVAVQKASRSSTSQYLDNGRKSVTRGFSGRKRISPPTIGALEYP